MPILVFSRRSLALVALATLVALAAALALRYGLIDVTAIAQSCEAGESSIRCSVRFAFNEGFRTLYPGLLAVLVGLATLVRPSVGLFGATLVLAALCLVLFSAWPGALALTLAILSLARPVRRATA